MIKSIIHMSFIFGIIVGSCADQPGLLEWFEFVKPKP